MALREIEVGPACAACWGTGWTMDGRQCPHPPMTSTMLVDDGKPDMPNPTPPASVDVAEGPCVSTPAAELENYITNYNVPKNEREWWACHEIARLKEALLTAAEQVASLRGALQKAPLPSMSGSADEFYQRFFDWLKNDVEPALERSALGAAP